MPGAKLKYDWPAFRNGFSYTTIRVDGITLVELGVSVDSGRLHHFCWHINSRPNQHGTDGEAFGRETSA